MTVKLIYIAAPFSGQSPEDVALNIEAARQYGKLLARKGWMPIIPHANTAGFDLTCPKIPYEFWIEGTLEMLRRCDAAFFGPGWENSSGSKGEMEEAQRLGLPVFFETRFVPELNPLEVRCTTCDYRYVGRLPAGSTCPNDCGALVESDR